jgi:hypothetical protein
LRVPVSLNSAPAGNVNTTGEESLGAKRSLTGCAFPAPEAATAGADEGAVTSTDVFSVGEASCETNTSFAGFAITRS